MSQPGLQDFLGSLNAEELLRVGESVPRDGLLSSLVLSLEKERKYPVIVLENVKGAKMPVVCNLFGSRERIARIIGCAEEDFYMHWHDRVARMIPPVMVQHAPVQEIVQTQGDIDLESLPISKHFDTDAGRYISSGIVVAKDPDTGIYNLSYHRMQLKERGRFGISLHSRGHLWDYFRRAKEKGQDLEIAVIVGCHPAVYLAASSKIGIAEDEYQLAGALMGEPLELTPCKTVGLAVPASAEIVFEGKILASEFEDEGPFGEYTGYSTSRSTRNIMEVTAVTRREKCVFMDLVPGYSSEHLLLGGMAKQAENLYLMKDRCPYVKNIYLPKSGTHFHAYIQLQKTAEGQPRQAMTLLAGLDQYIKFIVAVDEDIDIYDEEQVLWAMATRMQPDEDVMVLPKLLCNVLDPSSHDGMSSKLLIDATKPLQNAALLCREQAEAKALAREIIAAHRFI